MYGTFSNFSVLQQDYLWKYHYISLHLPKFLTFLEENLVNSVRNFGNHLKKTVLSKKLCLRTIRSYLEEKQEIKIFDILLFYRLLQHFHKVSPYLWNIQFFIQFLLVVILCIVWYNARESIGIYPRIIYNNMRFCA